jgi:hypothetical protein
MARRLAGDVIADVILEQFGRQPGDGVPDRSYQHQHVGIVIVVAGSGPKIRARKAPRRPSARGARRVQEDAGSGDRVRKARRAPSEHRDACAEMPAP